MGRKKIIIIATILFVTVSGALYSASYGKQERADSDASAGGLSGGFGASDEEAAQSGSSDAPGSWEAGGSAAEGGAGSGSGAEEALSGGEDVPAGFSGDSAGQGGSSDVSGDSAGQGASADGSAGQDAPPSGGEGGGGGADAASGQDAMIYVHVCGEVASPGVYALEGESRAADAVSLAGGLTKEAAEDAVNLAQKLEDGQKLYIPSKEEVESGQFEEGQLFAGATPGSGSGSPDQGGSASSGGGEPVKVDINRASKEELLTLTGIGEAKADAILQYREEHGRFSDVSELKNVDGIKDGILNKIKDQIVAG